jgi:cholesterol transport system auxiliary component
MRHPMKHSTTRLLVIWLAFMASWGLAGCLNFSKEFPAQTYYALEVSRQGPDPVAEPRTVLKVKKFRILPRFEGKELVYRTGEYRYESDYYHEWFVAPNGMVTQQVQDWLAAAGLFEHVLGSGSAGDETHMLEGTVTALYGDYRNQGSPKAVVGLQVVLFDEGLTNPGILIQREYQRDVALSSPTPEALMQGWNDALRLILAALEEDVKKAVAKPASPPRSSAPAAKSQN